MINLPLAKKTHIIKIPALLIGIILFVFILNYPILENQQAQKALALLVMVAVLWMAEAIPLALTGLLIPVTAIFIGLFPDDNGFKEFAHPIIFLFMGGFVMAGVLTRHGIDKIFAKSLIKLARGNFYLAAIFLMFATALTACWVSNTGATAMMIPLGIGLVALLKMKNSIAESKFLILGIAYSANIGGVITMIASPPNAIGSAVLGLSFYEWMKYSVPIFLITFPIMILALTIFFKPDRKIRIGEMFIEKNQNAPYKTITTIFIFTVTLWMLDSYLSPFLGIKEGFNSIVAIIAIFLIYGTGVLKWEEILKSIQWEVLLLFGGGLTLGMLIDSSGLGLLLVSNIAELITVMPMFLFLWLIVLLSIMLTEFMSNTASAAMILPMLFTLANQLDINPMILVLPATIAASFGFMLPAGTPPNAMAFATGLLPQDDMIKTGLVLDFVFSIILTTFFYLIFI